MRYDFPPWNGIGDVLKMHTAWPSSVIRQKQILDVMLSVLSLSISSIIVCIFWPEFFHLMEATLHRFLL